MKRMLTITMIVLSFFTIVRSEGILSYNDHLLQEKITGMAQDERGFIWISTWGGLYRYDGHSFVQYKMQSGDGSNISTDRLDAVRVDCYGNLWCHSLGRVVHFDVRTSRFTDVLKLMKDAPRIADKVKQIYPMKDGTVWMKTDGNVVMRTDARNLNDTKFFSAANGMLCGGKVLDIKEDSRGRVWVLTEQGIRIFGEGAASLSKSVGSVKAKCSQWCETTQGRYYFVADGALMTVTDNGSGKRPLAVRLPDGVGKIIKLIGNKKGQMAAATENELLTCEGGKLNRYPFGNPQGKIHRLYHDHSNRYWVTTATNGVWMLRGTTLTHLSSAEGSYANESDTWFFSEQVDGTVLLMSSGEGLCRYNPASNTLTHLHDNNGGWHTPQVGRSFTDDEGNLWIHNVQSGLERFRVRIPQFSFTSDGATCCLYQDSKGRLWRAMTDGTVAVSKDGANSAQYHINAMAHTMLEGGDGTMWIGTKNNGLIAIDNDGSMRTFRHDDKDRASLSADDVFCLCFDKQKRLWVGTYSGGLNVMTGQRFLNSQSGLKGLPKDYLSQNIRSLLLTSNGVMCVGTSNGLFAFKPNSKKPTDIKAVRHCRDANNSASLSSNEVMNMTEGKGGMLYIVTPNSGVCAASVDGLLKGGIPFAHYDVSNGAPSDKPMAVKEDGQGQLWIVYPQSVAILDKQRQRYHNVTDEELSHGMTFSAAGICLDGQGHAFIGTNSGMATLDLATLSAKRHVPRIAISSLLVEGKAVNYNADMLDTLSFNYDERDISIRLSALMMTGNEGVSYAYRTSEDGTWIMQGSNAMLSFTNLSSGYHTIQVKSTDATGTWADNVRTIILYVKPTFWETPWAIALYFAILCIIAGSVAGIWAYVYRLKLKMRAQEDAIKQRMYFVNEVAPRVKEEKDDLVEKVRSYIDKHIDNDALTIPDIANAMGMSRASFFAKFKQLTDLSPQDYLTHYRIEYAKRLLQQDGSNISECAYRSGFADPKYFSRVFKRIEGITPTAFVKAAKS